MYSIITRFSVCFTLYNIIRNFHFSDGILNLVIEVKFLAALIWQNPAITGIKPSIIKKHPPYNILYNTIINTEHDNKFNHKMPVRTDD